jgi:hypothetical protein
MKKYFVLIDGKQYGPLDMVELKGKEITRETPVWYEGLGEWKNAGEINELIDIIPPPTPPIPPKYKSTSEPKKEKSKKPQKDFYSRLGSILQGIGVIGAILIVGAIVVNLLKQNSSSSASGYQQKIMTIEEIERSQPAKFLKADGTYRENFWGDKFKIKCTISNKATVASYKDPVVRVTYYSKTKTVLARNSYTIYEVFQPHSEKTVDLKIDNYKDVNSIGWEVVSAIGL